MLREHLVQGAKVETTGAEDGKVVDKYQLRIHNEIERGNNESIKKMGSLNVGSMMGNEGCCGGGGASVTQ